MIEFEHVSKSYDPALAPAVDDLSLSVRDGEIFGLLGHNGAGKTTLLKMLVGVLAPSSGRILVDGFDVGENPLEAKRRLCFVDDSPDHLLRLKVSEYLGFVADMYAVPDERRAPRVERLAREYGMEGCLSDTLQALSHGMRQKVMIMGALLVNPPVWVLDEPLTGLDPRSSFTLKSSMRAHADAGNTVLFSTHVLDVAERVVDRVGVIDHGRLLFVGTVDEMRDHFASDRDESLEQMFLELTGGAPTVAEEDL